MDGFLDSAIVVDFYRGYQPAVQWLQTNPQLLLEITPAVWMEIVEGAQNKTSMNKVLLFVAQFPLTYLTEDDWNWAMRQLRAYHLSHQVGIMDCLIAAPCHRLQQPLYTRNLKHFSPLLGALVQQPY